MNEHQVIPCGLAKVYPTQRIQDDLSKIFDDRPGYDDFRVLIVSLLSGRDSEIIELRRQLHNANRRISHLKDLLWKIANRARNLGLDVSDLKENL